MKKSKFTESQIVQALKEHEAGKNVLPLLVLARINFISDSDINFPAGETPPAES